jgi:hypothetical protein
MKLEAAVCVLATCLLGSPASLPPSMQRPSHAFAKALTRRLLQDMCGRPILALVSGTFRSALPPSSRRFRLAYNNPAVRCVGSPARRLGTTAIRPFKLAAGHGWGEMGANDWRPTRKD